MAKWVLLQLAVCLSTVFAFTATPPMETLPLNLKGNPATFTPKPFFPSEPFKEFYKGFGPSQTSVQPQPVVTDPVNGVVFPLELTNPATIPEVNLVDPVVFAPSLFTGQPNGPLGPRSNLSTPGSRALANQAFQSITDIIESSIINGSCAKCIAGLQVAKALAITAPWEVPGVTIALCNMFNFNAFGGCQAEFSQNSDGDMATQILQYADVGGSDGQYICAKVINRSCPAPTAAPLNLTGFFPKPNKPANARAPPPSGKRVRVLHLSDFHLDPRYATGSESDCSEFLCCRPNQTATHPPPGGGLVAPAPRFGAYFCDVPYDLAGSALQAIPELAADSEGKFEWAIFTGDLVSHDNDNQLGRAYVEYEQVSIYTMMKQIIGGAPLYATLGNHDGWPQAFNSPLALEPGFVANQFSWNYDHISSLWKHFGWIDSQAQTFAKVHYGAYSIVTPQGLRIISFNTDFWYNDNWFNFINTDDPDFSGTFSFMVQELQAAEDAKQRVWIIGHIPPGWDGFSAIPNPSNLFYQIVDRYSPHVIAEIFFGHNHEDEFAIFYSNNATNISLENALATQWISPSLTPLTNLNSGFRAYDVDPVTFNVIDSYTWFANVSSFSALDSQSKIGAPFMFEYSAREAYGQNITWPTDAPLNATWWHLVTEQWEANPSLVETFTAFQGKSSVKTSNCTSSACVTSKICYARSGSQPIAALCPFGSQFGSVQ